MAGLLDYYKEHPELWAENEYLLAKDPAYNLGLMDLTKMNLEERRGGKPMTGLTKFLGSTLPNVFLPESMEQSSFSPVVSPLGSYSPSRGDIDLYAGAFTEGDVPTSYGEEEYRPVYNLDKAQIMAHENRHALTNMYPELSETQPSWSTLDPEKRSLTFGKRTGDPTSYHWMTEAFNRYLDAEDYPAMPFRTPSSKRYPVGLSGINRIGGIKPTDMYFDKIWRDKWKPHAKRYNKILKKIAARPRNIHGTPIVPMGEGRGRDEPSGADLSPGGGYGQSPTGSDIAGTPFSRGGRIGLRRGTSGAPGGGDPGMTSAPEGKGQTFGGGYNDRGGNVPPSMRGGASTALWTPPPKDTSTITRGESPFRYTRPQPNWVTRYNVNRPKGSSFFDRFWKHRANTQAMKGMVLGPMIPGTDESAVPTYTHALGGLDWKKNFPNTPELLDKALAYGYQHLTEGTRALTDPTSYGTGIFGFTKNLGNAFNKANVEAGKNIQGFTGEGIPAETLEKYQNWQALARGGILGAF